MLVADIFFEISYNKLKIYNTHFLFLFVFVTTIPPTLFDQMNKKKHLIFHLFDTIEKQKARSCADEAMNFQNKRNKKN
jgi:hypothetical protein